MGNDDRGQLFGGRLPGTWLWLGSFSCVADFHSYIRHGVRFDPRLELESISSLISTMDNGTRSLRMVQRNSGLFCSGCDSSGAARVAVPTPEDHSRAWSTQSYRFTFEAP